VDGTLIQAWASHKSFRRKDGPDDGPPAGGGRNADTDWKGEQRSNATHKSTTDPEARLFKKSHRSPAILCYHGHILMENRSGLVVGAVVSHADGFAERASALQLLDCVPGAHAKTVGADKAYDTRDFVNDCRARNVTPHVARNGYRISQIIRKRIEEHFGWGKTIGRIRQTVYRGIKRVDQHFKLTMVASNLTRMARMPGVVPQGATR
jgi:Transposase DDE domain